MSMTPASSEYFSHTAAQWDDIRAGYFSTAVREAAIRKAYLRPEMVVADVGAGTGFVAAGLAPQVQKVYVFDGSAEMLAVAQRNLAGFDNLVFQQADGLSLPLPDASLDAVFANMYLHHCSDPLAAIREMVRLLKPGGRLVLTDIDTHSHEWFREEMADLWLGFERPQIRAWFEQAGLVNVIVDSSGEACCAESNCADAPTDERRAQISVFVAVAAKRVSGARGAVEQHYRERAETGTKCDCSPAEDVFPLETVAMAPAASHGGGTSCCSGASSALISLDSLDLADAAAVERAGEQLDALFTPGYSDDEQKLAPAEAAEFSLGCGNPTALAGLREGEVVLDIGSGGGLDSFLAARKVGMSGRVIGVDMTPAMLERARASAAKNGFENVEFRFGQAETLPVDDASVDVILSNCVINLTEDKGRVFREAFRALRPAGRLEVSDMVTQGAFPAALRAKPENWGSCVFGALPEQEYLDLIAQAGFGEIQVRRSQEAAAAAGVRLYSALVSARKPA